MLALFSGSDDYRRRRAVQTLVAQHLPAADREFGLTRHEAATTSAAELAAALDTPPLFTPMRVTVVEGWEGLKGERLGDLRRVAVAFAERRAADGVLVLVSAGDRGFDADLVSRATTRLECPPLERRPEATAWVQQYGQEAHGVRCPAAVAGALVDAVGPDAGVLAAELDKLVTLADGAGLTVDLVHDAVAVSAAGTPYAWYDALGSRDRRGALTGLRRLLLDPEYPAVRLIIGVGAHFAGIAAARAALDAGGRPDVVAGTLGGWAGKKYVQQAAGWEQGELDRVLLACLAADLGVKRGRADRPTLEALVVRICETN